MKEEEVCVSICKRVRLANPSNHHHLSTAYLKFKTSSAKPSRSMHEIDNKADISWTN